MNKYHAKMTVVDSIIFASQKEARRYSELKLLERAGQIRGLELQPVFKLSLNGTLICRYVGDFAYFENEARVIEDTKSPPTKTPTYRLKIKMLKALFPGIDHREIM